MSHTWKNPSRSLSMYLLNACDIEGKDLNGLHRRRIEKVSNNFRVIMEWYSNTGVIRELHWLFWCLRIQNGNETVDLVTSKNCTFNICWYNIEFDFLFQCWGRQDRRVHYTEYSVRTNEIRRRCWYVPNCQDAPNATTCYGANGGINTLLFWCVILETYLSFVHMKNLVLDFRFIFATM